VLLIINTSTAKHVAFVDHSGNGLLDVFQVNFLFTKLTVENSMHLKTDTSVTTSVRTVSVTNFTTLRYHSNALADTLNANRVQCLPVQIVYSIAIASNAKRRQIGTLC